ncbi:MAG: hypothetical protein LLG06_04375, partial [Desulfobacteraceae bacterium]|nr:hypothetical protein [Desulfobacteraceae bacterium]
DYEGSGSGDILLQTLRNGAEIVLDGKGMINGRSVSVISSGQLNVENGFRAIAAGNLTFQTYSHDIRLMHSVYADATLIGGTATISFKTESGNVYLVDNVELASDFIDMTKVKGTVNDDGTTTVLGAKAGW